MEAPAMESAGGPSFCGKGSQLPKLENPGIAVKARKELYGSWWGKLADHVRQVRLALKDELPTPQLRAMLWGIHSDYADFVEQKLELGRSDPDLISAAGTGCNCIEGAFMWMGSWRPASSIMLACSTLCLDFEVNSAAAAERLKLELDALQKRTQQVEDGISALVTEHQMLNSGDVIQTIVGRTGSSRRKMDSDVKELEATLQPNLGSLSRLLMEAEQLRLHTLRELLETLTPQQAARCFIAGYEILFCLRRMSSEKVLSPKNLTLDGVPPPLGVS